ncbi:sporulation-delaying protein SdpB family protein [Microbacterium suaedae]|uniref:sporulation-delaying protein SdpB family protein n=1 Tax=Microbacterium suaedae TaxID=2067813 RepID=UPI0013A6759B|nr:sporulation-delaying protein SdpB family protein [Microbacterium suaedae]
MTSLTQKLDRYIARTSPFTPVVGTARTILALSTAITLTFTPSSQLFFRSENYPDGVTCSTEATSLSFFCLTADQGVPTWSVIVAIGVLFIAAIGVLPRWTCIPHWYLTWSLAAGSPLPDGGDHLASNLTLILIPFCLFDGRLTHWRRDDQYRSTSLVAKYIAYACLGLWIVQLMGVYLQASIAKMAVTEWADGSALWYWLQNPTFGPAEPIRSLTLLVFQFPVISIIASYGTLVLQLALVAGPFMRRRARQVLLILGIAFHGAIAIVMGLWSFSAVMIAADILLLLRPDEQRGLSFGKRISHPIRPSAADSALRQTSPSPTSPS